MSWIGVGTRPVPSYGLIYGPTRAPGQKMQAGYWGTKINLLGDPDKKPLKSDRSAAEKLVGLDEDERNDERSVKSFPAMKSKSKMISKVAKSKTSRLTQGEGKEREKERYKRDRSITIFSQINPRYFDY